jgi:hypothetical protein
MKRNILKKLDIYRDIGRVFHAFSHAEHGKPYLRRFPTIFTLND